MFHTRINMTAVAAVALALVLLNVFTNNDFFSAMLKFVVNLISQVGGMLP